MFAENEDFGNGDWVEPSFDPAPDRREEGGCTNYLLSPIVSSKGVWSRVAKLTNILSSVSG